ncbi:Imm26 family immunity protein [Acanthopleuribacter pedis]|uniref:Immunity protein 26 of polymorphic toxin system n=1 Tax=Acanthopleuribacter pedis TaxID=442870 RepID=A0A8J7Q0R2_9BACT|nr:Imm26 family immunity protein [Acanthopleuribacter pedis]MBO1318277.1 hypothetical protein [Acanthopleuribacter pedis]
MPRKKLNYQEGTCFFVPLENGEYGRGIVARLRGDGVVFGYFFGPALRKPEGDFKGLLAKDAALVGKFGDPGLLEKTWPIQGQLPDWNRAKWPLPPLYREDDDESKVIISHYDDLNMEFLYEEKCPVENAKELPEDALFGYVAAEIRLAMLLTS